MEAITHILTGIIIQILCFIYFVFPINWFMTAILAFFSHFLIDTLAKITYHTPEPHKEDKFWVIWHIITIALIFIVIAIFFFINVLLIAFFLYGAFFANLVDIWDWMILRPKHNKFKKENPNGKFWGEKLYIHPIIDWIREKPFFFLPNWNEKKKGVIFEILTLTILSLLIFYYFQIFDNFF
ncbi:MAG: hypothetical protein ACP6IY_12525 [Promethearchaeia archaeon]